MRFRYAMATLALVASTGMAPAAQAQIRGVTISDDGLVVDNAPWNLGYSFLVNSAVSVVSLGIWDAGRDGLRNSHSVGLWSSSGTLLASTSVGPGAILDNNFRYTNIAPIFLTVGQTYFVAGTFNGPNDDPWTVDPSILIMAPQISYDSRRYQSGSALVFPDLAGSNTTGYWGGDVRISDTVVATPEPATMSLLALGLVGVFAVRRRIR